LELVAYGLLSDLLAPILPQCICIAEDVACLAWFYKYTALLRDGLKPRQPHLWLTQRCTESSLTSTVMFASAGSRATLNLDAASGNVAFVKPWIWVACLNACDLLAVLGTRGTSGSPIITFFAIFNEAVTTNRLLFAARCACCATRWSIIAFLTSLDDPVSANGLQLAVFGASIACSTTRIALLAVGWGQDTVTADSTARALELVHVTYTQQVHERRPRRSTDPDTGFDAGQRLR
jgi:hypothetical protein